MSYEGHHERDSGIKNNQKKQQYHECQCYYAAIFKAYDLFYVDFLSKMMGQNLPKFGLLWLTEFAIT